MSQIQELKALSVDDATLPVINLAGLFSGDDADKTQVAQALGAAARTSGFFYITGHMIPQSVMDAAFAASSEVTGKPFRAGLRGWATRLVVATLATLYLRVAGITGRY